MWSSAAVANLLQSSTCCAFRDGILHTLVVTCDYLSYCYLSIISNQSAQDSTDLCSSLAVILGESLATQTLLLTLNKDDIDTCPHSGRFITYLVDWNLLIITLMVEMGIFNALTLFLQPLSIL